MLSAAEIQAVVSYDSMTGEFVWNEGQRRARKIAGCVDADGYRRISIGGKLHQAHRLAWVLVNGAPPTGQIDHINGLKGDNRIANLRDVSGAENQQNRHRAQGANRFPWVSWKNKEKRWRAAFRVNGKTVTVGHFSTAESAYAAALARRAALGLLVSPSLAEAKAA